MKESSSQNDLTHEANLCIISTKHTFFDGTLPCLRGNLPYDSKRNSERDFERNSEGVFERHSEGIFERNSEGVSFAIAMLYPKSIHFMTSIVHERS